MTLHWLRLLGAGIHCHFSAMDATLRNRWICLGGRRRERHMAGAVDFRAPSKRSLR